MGNKHTVHTWKPAWWSKPKPCQTYLQNKLNESTKMITPCKLRVPRCCFQWSWHATYIVSFQSWLLPSLFMERECNVSVCRCEALGKGGSIRNAGRWKLKQLSQQGQRETGVSKTATRVLFGSSRCDRRSVVGDACSRKICSSRADLQTFGNHAVPFQSLRFRLFALLAMLTIASVHILLAFHTSRVPLRPWSKSNSG